ncbi:type VI secretion system baseplate subunit TssF [Serratia fonticola]|uniref:Type VI secretion system baseplate subunit TssF n=1 Tax=Serratia fonticola TaxID=47917 RepID=A0ABY9PTA6_SERFO|nr:type VI secretion system baseplate subunit TssF [Serratia fonticola]WMT16672.1 type VI secretion system baseplate subunit TssF [Serratia fonticola]
MRLDENVTWDNLSLDKLTFYLSGPDVEAMQLLELLMQHTVGIFCQQVDSPRQRHYIPKARLNHEGFEADQVLLPNDLRNFDGYRLLQEYFAFPARFRLFSVSGLAPLFETGKMQNLRTREFEIVVLLSKELPLLAKRIDASHFSLHCTPVINLFPKVAERITLNNKTNEYHLVVGNIHPLDYEVFSVHRLWGTSENNQHEQEFRPFYCTQGRDAHNYGAYFSQRRSPRPLSAKSKQHGSRSKYLRFLPGSSQAIALRDWVRHYLGIEYLWDVRLILRKEEVNRATLGGTACARCAVSQHAEPGQVENCRRRIEALETEREIAMRDARIGAGDAERPTQIDEQLELERQQLAALNYRWNNELGLVNEMIELHAKLFRPSEAEEQDEVCDEAGLRSQLNELQQQLTTLQNNDPLIFPTVDASTIASVIADWTGIPLGRMMKNEVESVLSLAETLNQRVIGQKHGLEAIASRLITSRASLGDPNKHIGVFMLCGPSCVGKTETAHALAESFYGGERNVITINMSEFQESHTVSTLKGAPPGYVGYGEGGALTEAVRRRPYSVILLDEVEKAHSDVHEIFYQVFDKGWMEDGEGLRIDFRNTIIILTSNVGSEVVSSLCADPALLPDTEQLTAALRAPLLRAFPAALLGRLMVIPYYPLSDEVLGDIVKLQLERIRQRLLDSHHMTCSFDDRMIQQIVSRCTEVESGGRLVDNILTNTLLPQISHRLLTASSELNQFRHLHISYTDKHFDYDFQVDTPNHSKCIEAATEGIPRKHS